MGSRSLTSTFIHLRLVSAVPAVGGAIPQRELPSSKTARSASGWVMTIGPTLATDVAVYFCDPQSPWQRGSNENTNRLLRQYFPKGRDLSAHSQERLNEVAREMNQRPRKTLDYETPADRLDACVAMIA